MKCIPINQEGYRLLHKGTLALSRAEHNGIRIDVPLLKKTREDLAVRLIDMEKELRSSDVWKIWRKKYGNNANLGSGRQLGSIFFSKKKHGGLGYISEDKTDTGEDKTNQNALERIGHPFIAPYLRWKKLSNAKDNFLLGIQRETCDGFLHPVFNLHLVRSFRSSSDSPNFQNFPVRDEEISRLIRSVMMPRKGRALVENDFKGLEVGMSCCYNEDPKLISYVCNPKLDMHRDTAMEMFFLKKEQVTKIIRYCAKNMFVFPQFYGDWYKSCAENIWENIKKLNLIGPDGKLLYSWLKKNGIRELGDCDPDNNEPTQEGTFVHHVKEIENKFWNVRFKTYTKWKRSWYKSYLKNGYFDSKTGFRYEGLFDRKQVCNYPIQGSGFHALLWTFIEAMKEIDRTRAERLLIGQIHDSMLSDVPINELDDHNALMKELVEVKLRKHWDWINVPLEVETEICGQDKSWFHKKAVKPLGKGMYNFNDVEMGEEELLEALQLVK